MSKTQLGELIAQGRTADIHIWVDDQTVIKLYHNWFQLPWIQKEAARSRAIQGLGLPIPKVGELIQVNGRNGLIFERVDGENMLTLLMQKPALVSSLATRLADLHLQLHAVDRQPDIPLQHQKLKSKIRRAAPLSDALKAALIDGLYGLPNGRSVCHGDFHSGNIMVTTDGQPKEVIVDWNDCTFGNPLADVARSTILFLGGITGNETPNPAFEAFVRSCHQQYLERYFKNNQHDRKGYEQWLPIVAGARLSENIKSLEPWLLSEAQKGA
ncbi:MAG: aminoglycoside phosphotransferase family protein [Chloroflexota bacterium]